MQMEEEEQQFKVPPILSQDKSSLFCKRVTSALLGLNFEQPSLLKILFALIISVALIVIPLTINNYGFAIGSNIVIALISTIVFYCAFSSKQQPASVLIQKIIVSLIYGGLWGNHFYYIGYNNQLTLIIFSSISIVTSFSAVCFQGVRQFSANYSQYSSLGWTSTSYVRLLIAIPSLLCQFSFDLSSSIPSTPYIFTIRSFTSIIFFGWWFGWISSMKTTLRFIIDRLNVQILGDQSKPTLGVTLACFLLNGTAVSISVLVYHDTGSSSLLFLIIGATITSLVCLLFIVNLGKVKDLTITRIGICLILECLVCLLLSVVYAVASTNLSANVITILVIDIVCYLFFNLVKQLSKGWSRFGCKCQAFHKNSKLLYIEHLILRTLSALSVIAVIVRFRNELDTGLEIESELVGYLVIPILGFRAFKRCLSSSRSFSLHISIFLGLLSIAYGSGINGCLTILLFPALPANFYLSLLSPFDIPPKLKHPKSFKYSILYLVCTLVGLFLHIITFGNFQLTMIFGLPIYFPGYEVQSSQISLYEKIINTITSSLMKFQEAGQYLLRIEKYIVLVDIQTVGYGICEVLEFRGLQVQQVTSCHSKEGDTIDQLVEQTWGVNSQSCFCTPYFKAITPLFKQNLQVPTQNDIQLTGILEAKQFVVLFQQAVLYSLVRQISKMELSDEQKKQGQLMAGELGAFYKKERAESIFPFQFAKKCGLEVSYPSGKVKLPPIKKNKKNQIMNDFLDLVENSEQQPQQSLIGFENKESTLTENRSAMKMEQINLAIVLTFYYYTVGKQDYVNTQKLFKIVKREKEVVPQVDFQGFQRLASLALGAAFKISIDKYIEGQMEINQGDFQAYEKDAFLGTNESQQFRDAMRNAKPDIWTLSFPKKALAIRRISKNLTQLYAFKIDEMIIKAVWNNLRFQLIFAANDNDQRYSIQTHPSLLRNLWVEACQQPFGYPSYMSGSLVNC